MTFRFGKVTFEGQLQQLENAGEWLCSLGIKTTGTRFDEILQLNRKIVEHHKNGEVDSLIEQYGNLKLWGALTEASSFIHIHEAFENQKSHLRPKSKLKKMIEGPYHSWDEDVNEGNIEARNILFELETAAIFERAGTKMTGFDDVDFVFNKNRFNVQCKRIHSEKKVKDNVDEAAKQFFKKMKSAPNLKGIICLSIDKLHGKETMLLKVKSAEEIRPKLDMLSNSFIANYRGYGFNLINTNILAILIIYHVVAIIQEEPYELITACRDIVIDVRAQQSFLQMVDYNLIHELGKKLQEGD